APEDEPILSWMDVQVQGGWRGVVLHSSACGRTQQLVPIVRHHQGCHQFLGSRRSAKGDAAKNASGRRTAIARRIRGRGRGNAGTAECIEEPEGGAVPAVIVNGAFANRDDPARTSRV